MDNETQTAIQRSIDEIWRPRAEGKEINIKCFLCELNIKRCVESSGIDIYDDMLYCKYCIIKEITGDFGCRATNNSIWKDNTRELGPDSKEAMQEAQIMVNFLEGLLDDRG